MLQNLTEILQIPKIMVLMEYYFPKQENVTILSFKMFNSQDASCYEAPENFSTIKISSGMTA